MWFQSSAGLRTGHKGPCSSPQAKAENDSSPAGFRSWPDTMIVSGEANDCSPMLEWVRVSKTAEYIGILTKSMKVLSLSLSCLAVALLVAACVEGVSTPAVPPQSPQETPSPTPMVTSQVVSQTPLTATTTAASSPTPDIDTSCSRRTPFVPLDNPDFIFAGDASYLLDDELVLGVEWGNESRAYPVQMLTYHHIVNDTVEGRPVLITY